MILVEFISNFLLLSNDKILSLEITLKDQPSYPLDVGEPSAVSPSSLPSFCFFLLNDEPS